MTGSFILVNRYLDVLIPYLTLKCLIYFVLEIYLFWWIVLSMTVLPAILHSNRWSIMWWLVEEWIQCIPSMLVMSYFVHHAIYTCWQECLLLSDVELSSKNKMEMGKMVCSTVVHLSVQNFPAWNGSLKVVDKKKLLLL